MVATFEDIDYTCTLIKNSVPRGTIYGGLFNLLYNTGLRIEEAIQLKRFTLTSTTFTIDTEKNSLNRTFPLSILPFEYFEYLPYAPSPLSRGTFGSYMGAVRNLLAGANRVYYNGEKNILTNIFRYRYVLYLQSIGYSFEQIKEEMGHLSNKSTASYLAVVNY